MLAVGERAALDATALPAAELCDRVGDWIGWSRRRATGDLKIPGDEINLYVR